MPCYRPLQAFKTLDGAVVFSELRRYDITAAIDLPCGQCIGCRLERSRQWAIRCVHEAQMHKENCFITLTYNDEHLPAHKGLDYREYQLFMKRLRKHAHKKIRFYMCGEYGEQFGRPHFHACLFGYDFNDKTPWKKTPSGEQLYKSETLSKIWGKGFTSIGNVTFQSAAYVARYIMKKITGDLAEKKYEKINEQTGEIEKVKPEFNHMSLKPGIGATWLEKYESDVYPEGRLVINGKEVKPPKYYDRKYQEISPLNAEEIAWQREKLAKQYCADNTTPRLQQREQVTAARIRTLKRKLK